MPFVAQLGTGLAFNQGPTSSLRILPGPILGTPGSFCSGGGRAHPMSHPLGALGPGNRGLKGLKCVCHPAPSHPFFHTQGFTRVNVGRIFA